MQDEGSRTHDVPLRWALAILAALFVLACVPVWAVQYPPMVDYPMHVARAYLLSLPQDGQGITEFYQGQIQAVPNLGMDLLVSALVRFMPPLFAGKLFLCLILFGILTGGFAFSVALQRRITVAAFLPALALYDLWFFMGFANFLFGIGIAFWAVAVFLWSEPWPRGKRWGVLTVFAVVLAVCHLMALVFAIGACVALTLKDRPKWSAVKVAVVGSLAACAVAYVGLTLTGRVAIRWDGRADTLTHAIGVTSGLGIVGFLAIVFLGFGGARAARSIPLLAALLVFMGLGPSFLIGTAFASDRLTLPCLIVMFASLQPSAFRVRPWPWLLLGVGAALAFTLKMVRWKSMAEPIPELVQALATVPERSTIATFDVGLEKLPTWRYQRHVADWVLLERPVFVAQNFAKPHQQPMVFRPDFEAWHEFQDNNPVELMDWSESEPKLVEARVLQSQLNKAYAAQGKPPAGLYVLFLYPPDYGPPVDWFMGQHVVGESKAGFTLLKVE